MRGPLIETEARVILNQGIKLGIEQAKNQMIKETKKEVALKILEKGKLTIEEVSYCVGLSAAEVEQLAGSQTA